MGLGSPFQLIPMAHWELGGCATSLPAFGYHPLSFDMIHNCHRTQLHPAPFLATSTIAGHNPQYAVVHSALLFDGPVRGSLLEWTALHIWHLVHKGLFPLLSFLSKLVHFGFGTWGVPSDPSLLRHTFDLMHMPPE